MSSLGSPSLRALLHILSPSLASWGHLIVTYFPAHADGRGRTQFSVYFTRNRSSSLSTGLAGLRP